MIAASKAHNFLNQLSTQQRNGRIPGKSFCQESCHVHDRLRFHQSGWRTVRGSGSPFLVRLFSHTEMQFTSGNDIGMGKPGTGQFLAVQLHALDKHIVPRVIVNILSRELLSATIVKVVPLPGLWILARFTNGLPITYTPVTAFTG